VSAQALPEPSQHGVRALTRDAGRQAGRQRALTEEIAHGDAVDDIITEILDAAAVAFMTRGYAATSIDDVADLLHATKGKIYHHYRKKADLFYDVHRRAMDLDLAAVRAAADAQSGSALARLRAMARAHVFVIMDHLPYQRVAVQGLDMHLAGETTSHQRAVLAEILALRDRYEAMFAEAIKATVAECNAPAQDITLVVKAFIGALNWTTIWYRERPGQSLKEKTHIADTIATYALRGLGVGE
jgi:AcrR family transcriptional regulator